MLYFIIDFRKDHDLIDVSQAGERSHLGGESPPGLTIPEGGFPLPQGTSDLGQSPGELQIHSAPADLDPQAEPLLSRTTKLRQSLKKLKIPPIVTYHII